MSGRFQNLELVEVQQTASSESESTALAYLQEATLEELDGSFEPALKAYSAALRRETTLAEAWSGQVRSLIQLEEFPEAMTWAQKACNVLPASPQVKSCLAYALARSGLPDEGMEKSDEAFESESSEPCPFLWLERGTCLMALERQSSALACFGKVRELRTDADWQQRIAQEYLFFEQPEAALELLDGVVAARPNRAYAWLLLAQGYRQIGDVKRHGRALSQAAELRPFWEAVDREKRLGLPFPLWVRRLVNRLRGK